MLSRTADSIWWMSRYLERAENVARFVDVTQAIALGAAAGDAQWAPLVYASGDEKLFLDLYREFTQANVLGFLLFDEANPNSIHSCLRAARENARGIRDSLSTPLWEAVNRFYLRVREVMPERGRIIENPYRFLERVKRSSHQTIGVTHATMSHGEAWHFAEFGRLLERADKTSRILDVKYFILSALPVVLGSPGDTVQWSALLESTSALHMYRKRFGRIEPLKVAEFLLLDEQFPRSLRFCVDGATRCLAAIVGAGPPVPAVGLLRDLAAELRDARIEAVVAHGLHEFVDGFQSRLNAVGAAVGAGFFVPPPDFGQTQQ